MVDVGCRTGHRFSHDTGAFGLTGPCLSLSNDYHLLFNQFVRMSLSFKGHTVVVTGAGGGLGKALVYVSSFS